MGTHEDRNSGTAVAPGSATDPFAAGEPLDHTLFENMLDGYAHCRMLYDAEGRPADFVYIYVNPAFARLTGLTDVIGKRVSELIPGVSQTNPELFEMYGRAALHGERSRFETCIEALGIWFSIAVYSPRKDHFVAIFEDITERIAVQDRLRLTQISVDRAADLIHWVAPDGGLLYVSDSNCRRHGYTRQEMLGMSVFDLDPSMTPAAWVEHWSLLKERGSLAFETSHRSKDGEIFPLEVTANFVEQDGREYNFAFARDISERRRAENEITEAKAALERANAELLETQHTLEVLARTDTLTGAMNRRAILERLHLELLRADRQGRSLALAMIDVDHFKLVNDSIGHDAGDEALREAVRRASTAIRAYDSLGRVGGEEFIVVLPDVSEDEAMRALERLRLAIRATPVRLPHHDVDMTVSIGVVLSRGESLDELIRLADQALYRAKAGGRDRVVLSEGTATAPARA